MFVMSAGAFTFLSAVLKSNSLRRKTLAALLLVTLTGCHRKHEDGSPVGMGGTLPGSCSWSVQDYAGALDASQEFCWSNNAPTSSQACTDRFQTVNVIANVIDYPQDRLTVVMYDGANTPRGTPNTNVSYRHRPDAVQFRLAAEAGYVRYTIHAEACR